MSLPSYRVEASEEEFIAAPLHRVWQVLRQIERWEQWNPHVRLLSTSPRIHPRHFCWKASGIRFHTDIVAERPPRTLQWKSVARGIVEWRSWMLIPDGVGTQLITHVELEGVALCIRPEASGRLLRLRTHQMLDALRRAAEGMLDTVHVN